MNKFSCEKQFLRQSEVFILAILLLIWQGFFDLNRSSEYDLIEYYAGVARIARLGASSGLRAGAFDVVYDTPKFIESWATSPLKRRVRTTRTKGKSAMDLTTSAGFTLLLLKKAVLRLPQLISSGFMMFYVK